ncbi:MAG: sigma-54-dependent Fis family transcriptional regulator [Chlorobi bacterium]|nr:sigma-54-dependent Fis family transcriptional regulator [Chlorobiota bacterium]
MKLLKILVIDDEKLIRWSFEKKLNSDKIKVYTAGSGEDGIETFQMEHPHIVFLDNKLPKMQGLDVLKKIKKTDEDAVIVFMTAYESVDVAVKAMKAGAYEYINKPFSFEEINIIIKNITDKINKDKEIRLLRREKKDFITFDHIIGSSEKIKKIIRLAKKIAKTETTTILLLGESGTGKDLFSKAIHNESARKDKPFVTINCSSLPETLLESELFGYETGAFTDAKKQKKGLFEVAEGGTVFLDEIGEINQATQLKLLNVLENRTVRRLGGTVDIPVDIRIIAATNRNLKKSVEEKLFREDLYYRIKVFQITVPPLRERKEDIPELINYFIEQFNRQFGKNVTETDPEVLKLMMKYDWPGNVRELRNVIERAVILETDNILYEDCLPGEIREHNCNEKKCNPYNFILPDEGLSLEEMEKEIIRQALEKTDYNQTKAAKLLRISRDTLRYKKKKHKL